ncbi:response regulator [Proteinivorax tanatarense]|uniref:Stage 0 sporulation protein A homolog n=1 Tax=Proteinivorax tanatarense TaxID=1260629 RepID=A0AAU7VM56_9FIRM
MRNLTVLQKIKVLYIEDEPITQREVSKFLKPQVGKLITASNGLEGIKSFFHHEPDIIITDLIMGDMNGIEMMKNLRNEGVYCPLIITSSLSDSETILKTVDLKIEKFLIKPINLDSLINTLESLAIDIVEKRENIVVVNKDFILDEAKKAELELKIRNLYSKYLKDVTGKGANLVNVFINGKEIEILLKQPLTRLEESLLNTNAGSNYKLVEIIRRTIYEDTIDDFLTKVSLLIDRKVGIKKIDVYPKERIERILIEIR